MDVALGLVGTDEEAVVRAVIVSDTSRAARTIHVARTVGYTAVSAGEVGQANLTLFGAVLGTGAHRADAAPCRFVSCVVVVTARELQTKCAHQRHQSEYGNDASI